MPQLPGTLLRTFATGLLAALPLAGTVAIFVWGAKLLYGWLGPSSLLGGVLMSIGFGVSGSRFVGYLIGVAILGILIFLLGLLVEMGLQRSLAALVDRAVGRIPLVRNVYELIKKFVDLVSLREQAGMKTMSPVWCRFGGDGNVAVLGLLSAPDPVLIGGQPHLAVLVPTSPVPVGGGLLYVPQAWVTPADVGMEGLMSIYVSMGVTSNEHLGRMELPAGEALPAAPDVGASSRRGGPDAPFGAEPVEPAPQATRASRS